VPVKLAAPAPLKCATWLQLVTLVVVVVLPPVVEVVPVVVLPVALLLVVLLDDPLEALPPVLLLPPRLHARSARPTNARAMMPCKVLVVNRI
jgi:hypothetical protein